MGDCQFTGPDNDMLISFFNQWRVTGPPICTHATARRNMTLNKAAETLCRGIRHTLEANSADTPSCLASIPFILNTDHNQSFALGSPTALPGLYATDVRLIYLDHAGQCIPPRPHHGPAQSMQPSPGCMVTTQTQHALEAQGVRAELLVSDVPHGLKPHFQRFSSVMKQRTRRNRYLSPALAALKQATPSLTSIAVATCRARKSIRPTKGCQVFQAWRLVSETFLKLEKGGREIDHTLHYILGYRESSA